MSQMERAMAMQMRSLWMEAVVDGSRGNGGLCQWQSSSSEAAFNDAMALSIMASSANSVAAMVVVIVN
jgi:hypothetical protein